MEKTEQKQREFKLPNKKVILRPLLDKTPGMIKDRNHAASFLVGNADKRVSLPRIEGRAELDYPLTPEETEFFEDKRKSGLNFETGDLSVWSTKWGKRKNKTWWETKVAQLVLKKDEIIFDLSKPIDYLRYKICLKNKNLIARSMDDLKYSPDALYVFVEKDDAVKSKSTVVAKKKEAYKILSDISKSRQRMFDMATALGKRVADSASTDFLETVLYDVIEENVDKFLAVLHDEYVEEKVLIARLLKNRLIDRRGNQYFLKDGSSMCDKGDIPYIENACAFLKAPENQETRLFLESKLEAELKLIRDKK